MSNTSINPAYVAHAYRWRDQWQVRVTETFGSHTETATTFTAFTAHSGTQDEAWRPLRENGWVMSGRTWWDNDGLHHTVAPPLDARVNSLNTDEYQFVVRCAARGVPSHEALRAYQHGSREFRQFVAHYKQNQDLEQELTTQNARA